MRHCVVLYRPGREGHNNMTVYLLTLRSMTLWPPTCMEVYSRHDYRRWYRWHIHSLLFHRMTTGDLKKYRRKFELIDAQMPLNIHRIFLHLVADRGRLIEKIHWRLTIEFFLVHLWPFNSHGRILFRTLEHAALSDYDPHSANVKVVVVVIELEVASDLLNADWLLVTDGWLNSSEVTSSEQILRIKKLLLRNSSPEKSRLNWDLFSYL